MQKIKRKSLAERTDTNGIQGRSMQRSSRRPHAASTSLHSASTPLHSASTPPFRRLHAASTLHPCCSTQPLRRPTHESEVYDFGHKKRSEKRSWIGSK